LTNNSFSTQIKGDWKYFNSPDYNYHFNLKTGYFARWGKTFDDDPPYSRFGPEIADIEISTICDGHCPYCYKANIDKGKNMSFDVFKKVIKKINSSNQLTQVAFGLGATGEENSELWDMCVWLREQNIIPNGTVANVSEKTAQKIAAHFGACAVSDHFLTAQNGNNLCYDNVRRLSDCGTKQVNIHYVIARESVENAYQVLRDIKRDERLKGLNALVFLSLKTKGRAVNNNFHPLEADKFIDLIQTALSLNISIGFDSCTFPRFFKAVEGFPNKEKLLMMAEGCEAVGRFSLYINVDGRCFPCSFCEHEAGWDEGFDVLATNFMSDVWNSREFGEGQKKLLKNNGACPVFVI
jgi:sulfatase maturation enzyme AslB (radical SAM superfamily)